MAELTFTKSTCVKLMWRVTDNSSLSLQQNYASDYFSSFVFKMKKEFTLTIPLHMKAYLHVKNITEDLLN